MTLNTNLRTLQKYYILRNIGVAMMQERRQRLFSLADRQAGYFTASQARETGYSDRLIHHHSAQGSWIKVGWGLYRLRDYPATSEEDLVQLYLWSRDKLGTPKAVVSHDTALALYELSDLMPTQYHLSVPTGFRKKLPPGVVLHPSALQPADVSWRNGYRITTPLRTLLDVARSGVSPEHISLASKQALLRGMIRRDTLEKATEILTESEQIGFREALSQP